MFELTVFDGLTEESFHADDKIQIQNIKGGHLFQNKVAQGWIGKLSSIKLIQSAVSRNEIKEEPPTKSI